MKDLKVIDLFCGAGGLSQGFHDAGFETVYALEFNKTFAKSFELNFPNAELEVADICNISNEYIREKLGNKKVDVIIGGPPCQGFSIAGNIGRRFLDDKRNSLFKEYLRFVDVLQPKMFVIENVAALERHNNGKTIKEITNTIETMGYKVKYKVLNAVNYNVPQERRRIFIVGSRVDAEFNYPVGNDNYITIKEAIDDLPKLSSGENSSVDLHFAMRHTEQMLRKMSYVKDGGDRNDIPVELRPKSGDIRKYIRYNSQKPCVCVTGDMRKIFHYSQNRALTCRELARIQTFPDSYRFYGSTIQVQQQIGNAVPPKLAYAVALEIKRCVENE